MEHNTRLNNQNLEYVANIKLHLNTLREDIELLEKILQKYGNDPSKIPESPIDLLATERLLERIATNIIDISFMLVSLLKLGSPKKYREGIEILCKEKILSKELCDSLQSIVGVRNILAHEYVEFELEKLGEDLPQKVKYFYLFIEEVSKAIDRNTQNYPKKK